MQYIVVFASFVVSTTNLKRILLCSLVIALTGCGSMGKQKNSNEPVGQGKPEPYSIDHAELDQRLKSFSQATNKDKPQIGLAMSGGGIRSAAYNIGVMNALQDAGIFNDIDIVSTVSGGTYALSWYISQNIEAEKHKQNWKFFESSVQSSDDETNKLDNGCSKVDFDKPETGKYQAHLECRGSILFHPWGYGKNRFTQGGLIFGNYALTTAKFAANVVTVIPHWVVNGIFGARKNLGFLPKYYEDALQRTFFLHPQDAQLKRSEYTNRDEGLFLTRGTEPEIMLSEIRKRYFQSNFKKGQNIPFFVINTTAHSSAVFNSTKIISPNGQIKSTSGKPKLEDKIFEFTPVNFGSNHYGLHEINDDPKLAKDFSLSHLATISGAALDGTKGKGIFGYAISAVNFGLGQYIPNPNYDSTECQLILEQRKGKRISIYRFDKIRYTQCAKKVYLTDGGHSENLGAFALIKRLTKNIIISDAEYDPGYTFGAYRKLRNNLKRDGIVMRIDGIEDRLKFLRTNEKCRKNKFFQRAGNPGFGRKRNNYHDGCDLKFAKLPGVTNEDNSSNSEREIAKHTYPVFSGQVSNIKFEKENGTITDIVLNVKYIKLAINNSFIQGDGPRKSLSAAEIKSCEKYYSDKSCSYFEKHIADRSYIFFPSSPFPQQTTGDQDFSDHQFQAYRDLGFNSLSPKSGIKPIDEILQW